MKNTHRGGLLLVKFTTSNTPPWCFLHFPNCTNGIKLLKASQIYLQSAGAIGLPVGAVVKQLLASGKNWIVAIIEIFGFEILVFAKVIE